MARFIASLRYINPRKRTPRQNLGLRKGGGKVMDRTTNLMRRGAGHIEGSDSVYCFGKDTGLQKKTFSLAL